jgi:hypothetical protein
MLRDDRFSRLPGVEVKGIAYPVAIYGVAVSYKNLGWQRRRGHCHVNSASSEHARAMAIATQRQRPLPTCQRSQREAA